MILLFLGGGGLLTAIFMNWHNERSIRFWETLRLRGYEQYYHRQYPDAQEFFQLSLGYAAKLGVNNFRYALSLADLAKLYAKQGDFDRSRQNLGKAISIFDRQTPFDFGHYPLREDQILLDCQLVELDLQSGKGVKKAWQDCQRGLNIYFKQKATEVDPTVSRTLCQTLGKIGDAAFDAGETEILQKTCQTTSKIASLNPSLKGLVSMNQKHMQCPFSAPNNVGLEDLIATAESELKSHHNKEAREALSKAAPLAESSKTAQVQIEYLTGRVDFAESNIEDAEKHFLAALPDTADDKVKDEMLLRLSQMYRQCGYPDDAIAAMKAEIEARKRMYGLETSKVTEIEIELARVLHDRGRIDEGKKYLKHALDYNKDAKKDGVGNLGLSSERLAAVLIKYGELKEARGILETIVEQYEQGMKKQPLWMVIALYDLAALNELEGKHADAERFLAQAKQQQAGLEMKDRMQLAAGTLRDCCFLLKDKAMVDQFIKETFAAMPAPADRREALRIAHTIDELASTFRAKHPQAFNKTVNTQMVKLRQATDKYPPASLKGAGNW